MLRPVRAETVARLGRTDFHERCRVAIGILTGGMISAFRLVSAIHAFGNQRRRPCRLQLAWAGFRQPTTA